MIYFHIFRVWKAYLVTARQLWVWKTCVDIVRVALEYLFEYLCGSLLGKTRLNICTASLEYLVEVFFHVGGRRFGNGLGQ